MLEHHQSIAASYGESRTHQWHVHWQDQERHAEGQGKHVLDLPCSDKGLLDQYRICQLPCSRRYADIVLPVVDAVLRSREHCMDVFQILDRPFTDLKAAEAELGRTVQYNGERMFLAVAIFAAAIQISV